MKSNRYKTTLGHTNSRNWRLIRKTVRIGVLATLTHSICSIKTSIIQSKSFSSNFLIICFKFTDTMSFNKGYSYCEIHTRPRPCCNSKCGQITTDMQIHFKYNQISTDQCILPTRFELYDDNILRLVWKLRFLVPSKLGFFPLSKLLDKFACIAVATDSILVKIGVKQNSEISS